MHSRALIDPDWRNRYAHKLCTRDKALTRIPRGGRIFVGSACAEPQFLVDGLVATPHLVDSEILHMLTLGKAPYAEATAADRFRHNAFFIGDNTRQAVYEGRADYTPVFLSELPDLFKSRRIRLDAALAQVSPPDRHGYVSLGVSVDVTRAALQSAKYVVGEVNENMPRTLGYSFLHVDEFDALVENTSPLIEYATPVPDEVALRLARLVAKLVEDGSTIQIGIGAIPNAVVPALAQKNDLGVHTEMFSDWMKDLVLSGVVTNRYKTLHHGKCIASFCMGKRDLYEWIDLNPVVSLHPSEYTNNPQVIMQNDKMVAINAALQVDLTGQVCSDSLGHRFYSGIGGQVDFIRGASLSRGGKAIIALPSTARKGTISTIVPKLSEGAGVVTTRGNVRYVVTEWGFVDLHGKSIRERAMALIGIAHPEYRQSLLDAAKEMNYIYRDQILPPRYGRYPEELEESAEVAGAELLLRPIKPTDEGMLKDLFYSLTDESVYRRYFSNVKIMPHQRLQEETNLDFETRMAIVAIPQGGKAEEMAGLGQFSLDPSTDTAEVSFLVRDDWQGKGLGKLLVGKIVDVARRKGFAGLEAMVMRDNPRMLHIFLAHGFTAHYDTGEDAFVLRLELLPKA